MNYTLSHDSNGNKILVVQFPNERGFSVQTLGNMSETHRMTKHDFNRHVAENELHGYVKNYGTDRQKELLGW